MPGHDSVRDDILLMLPEDDRAQLQGRATHQVRDWIIARNLAVQRYSSILQTVLNATLAVKSLPNEIFVDILGLASPEQDYRNTWITKATGVCRFWRDTIINTPLLWTKIDLTAKPHFIELCLARANGADICIRLPDPSGGYLKRSVNVDFPQVAPLLIPCSSRIKHIDLYIAEASSNHVPTSLMRQLLDVPLPALTSLALNSKGLQWAPSPQALHSLRHLSLDLSAVTPDWMKLPLSQLTSLTLSEPRFVENAPFASILGVLEACHSLEFFRFEGFEVDSDAPYPTRTLSLPQIRHIYLRGMPPLGTPILLAQLSLPQHARLSLEPYFYYGEVITRALDVLLPKDTRSLPAVCKAQRLMVLIDADEPDEPPELIVYADVDCTEYWNSKPWRSPEYELHWDFPNQAPFKAVPSFFVRHEVIPWQGDALKGLRFIMRELGDFFTATVETLVLRGITSLVDVQTWAQTMAAFPNLKELEIIGQDCDMHNFPAALEPTSSGVPCAQLRDVVLLYRPRKRSGSLRMLQGLRTALQMRLEVKGGSRLRSLSLLLVPERNDRLFPPALVMDQLPDVFRDTLDSLKSVVESFVFRCDTDSDGGNIQREDGDGSEGSMEGEDVEKDTDYWETLDEENEFGEDSEEGA
ncbi:uncharacterized protein C8Q71DRAFT_912004 [Rhodofomes roseus]|uniref:F-box domain-containing protein n=1 Tax=Rhodofomes roseus TaxID=34475 RepID=A0ABQ8JY28_9APHY|nr:uncharacterized protein C8Q71DRAFT_912004 [Rhodofomes roseus]KAH9829164.1 hypothetical protein C8Q71DRAFT_912004 [Rhodofomes roseus]